MPKGSGGRVSAKQKWIPKGSDVQAVNGEKENEDHAVPSSGPKYDRHELLRTYGTCRNKGGALPVLQESNAREASTELKYKLEDRPEGETIGKTRENRNKIKAVARQTSGSMDEGEAMVGEKVELMKELSAEGGAPAALDPMIMAYLQTMMALTAAPAWGAGFAGYTTVMLRNIPNRYTRDMLIERLEKSFKASYDFVYLPIDFSSRCNVGYAFINFKTPVAAQKFYSEFHGVKTKVCLPGFSSSKVAEVSFAMVQGKEANMENLRDEKFMEKLRERPEWQPLFLDENDQEVPFAKMFGGERKRSKRGSGTVAPTYISPTTPTGFMRPPPSFPPNVPGGFPAALSSSLPPAPPTTFESVVPSATNDTLLMLKGVPAKCTREEFVSTLKSKYGAAFNFIFLPNDTKGEGNRGHAFINFNKSDAANQFKEDFDGKTLSETFKTDATDKTHSIVSARKDSLEKSIARLQAHAKEADSPARAWLPLLFGEDGEEQPFPTLSAAEATKDEAEPKAKAKAKLNKQGSKDGTPGGAQRGYPYPGPGFYSGYPGYPPMPGYSPAVYHAYAQLAAAQNAQAIQVAQMQAQASARAHGGGKAGGKAGGKGGAAARLYPSILDPLAAAVNHKEDEELSEDSKAQLRHQVEYYFSTDNLCKDLFLREHMERDGWVSLNLIRTFPRVSKFSVSSKKLMEACAQSQKLEIDEGAEKIRLKNEEERSKWSSTPVPPDYKKRST